jgi:plasmid stabilization system protein ParE
MRSVVWSEKALVDFINKISDIAKESPENATLIADHVEQAVVELRDVPTGRFGLVRGARPQAACLVRNGPASDRESKEPTPSAFQADPLHFIAFPP